MHSHKYKKDEYCKDIESLNPCCNGRCTRTSKNSIPLSKPLSRVLILVVMEDALALGNVVRPIVARDKVLILVVMEDALAL